MSRATRIAALLTVCLALPVQAQAQNQGFAVGRYTPTAPGEWSFWVDRPWYGPKVTFAAGITLDYAHDPLLFGTRDAATDEFTATTKVIEHQMIGHLQLALAFFDRVNVSASLPITLLERGDGGGGANPLDGVAAGDLNFGVLVRLYADGERDPFSLHLGMRLWIPFGTADSNAGDTTVRFLPKLIADGTAKWFRWSAQVGFLVRSFESLGGLPADSGGTVGSELEVGASMAYYNKKHQFSIGPELVAATVVAEGHAFETPFTSLEVLLGVHWRPWRRFQLGLAGGMGALAEPGTPDFRAILRLALVPPAEEEPVPPPVDPCAGVKDIQELIRLKCPLPPDTDKDGVYDPEDLCPTDPAGDHPDPERRGCPIPDSDQDGVLDDADQCPTDPMGAHPDKNKLGCPDKDSDGDTVYDNQDLCISTPQGPHPDPDKPGCPLPDRDGDQIPDVSDACPDKPGAPSLNPKKHGCPGLVEMAAGKIEILKPVFFATNKDVILAKSFPVLAAVAEALKVESRITQLVIEGHTDNRGGREHNLELSQRRAESVKRWLVAHGIQEERLEAQGFGFDRPVADNANEAGRSKNRRVEFRIVEPAKE